MTRNFIHEMHSNAIPQAKYIAKHYDFTNHTILDIGAGAGTYSIEIAKKYNAIETLIDLPKAVGIIEEKVKEQNLQTQLEVSPVNYHPQNIFLKNIIFPFTF